MSASGIRDLSPEELALISGGAQMDTNDLPPVEVRPPDDWGPNPGPPDFTNPPFDPGPGDGDGGGGGGGGASDPSFTFTDVKPFESKLTYTPGEGANPGINTATITVPISTSSGQLSAITELKFNTDGSFQDGKGTLSYVGNDGTLLNWELRESNWFSTTTGGYYWDLGNGYGFKLQMSYDTSNNDLKGQAEFLYNKHP